MTQLTGIAGAPSGTQSLPKDNSNKRDVEIALGQIEMAVMFLHILSDMDSQDRDCLQPTANRIIIRSIKEDCRVLRQTLDLDHSPTWDDIRVID